MKWYYEVVSEEMISLEEGQSNNCTFLVTQKFKIMQFSFETWKIILSAIENSFVFSEGDNRSPKSIMIEPFSSSLATSTATEFCFLFQPANVRPVSKVIHLE